MNGSQFDTWTIKNQSWPKIDPLHVRQGWRYRMIFRNSSGDQHPMHLHRHTFEVTRVGTKEFSGLRKDVVNVMPLDSVAVDFVADNSGDTTAALPSGSAHGFRVHAAHEICGLI
jgi:FtsP/CotA-like multicopper oxidase with cupredoxin domain